MLLTEEKISCVTEKAGSKVLGCMVRASAGIATLTLIVHCTAMLKELLVAGIFGTSDVLDAYLVAMVIPTFLINALAGSFHSAIVPAYIKARESDREKEGQDFLAGAFFQCGAVLVVAGLVAGSVGHLIVPCVASGFHEEKVRLTLSIFYMLVPVVFLQGVVVTGSAILNARARFALAAITPVFLPVTTIVFLMTTARGLGIYSLVLGTLCGFAVQAAVIVYALKRQGLKLRPVPAYANTHVQKMMRQYVHILAGAVLMSGINLVDQAMAATLPAGSVSALNYGSRLVNSGIGLGAASLATAAFPYFSAQAVERDWDSLKRTLRICLRWIFVITVPLASFVFIFSEEIIRVIFERGSFLPKDTRLVGEIQSFLVMQVPFYIAGTIIARVVSSLQANQILTLVSVFNLLAKIAMNYFLMERMGVKGIALSTSLMYLLSFTLIYIYIERAMKR